MNITSKISITLFLFLLPLIVNAQDKPKLEMGGALRFNYNLSSWKKSQQTRYGDFGYDVFRLNAKAQYKGLKLDAEYRLYSQDYGGGMLHHGWVGYDINDKNNFQIGLTQVPFGITLYNSHSWFISLNYYIGLEDDHDMGLKYTHKGEHWEYAIAFFKNAEDLRLGNSSDVSGSRYSYDVASIDIDGDGKLDLRNKEINQFNTQVLYKFGNETVKHKIGVSGEYGGLYNLDTEEIGYHYSYAAHYELDVKGLNIKAQYVNYKYNAKNKTGESDNIIGLTAYDAPYLIASEASTYTLGVSYAFDVDWKPISNIQIYNDFGYMEKAISGFDASLMNVAGLLVTSGSIYTYIDFAWGKNQPWLGGNWTNSLAVGNSNANWEMRFNINIGYYF